MNIDTKSTVCTILTLLAIITGFLVFGPVLLVFAVVALFGVIGFVLVYDIVHSFFSEVVFGGKT